MTSSAHNLSSTMNISSSAEAEEVDLDETESLRTKILNVVKSTGPSYTIRPAKLSAELGISIDDASAELCGLLKAVGKGSTFSFESIDGINTMVFTFPPDFERKALARQRTEDAYAFWKDSLEIIIKVTKVLTAFGLIISTIIVSIAGMIAMLAALVALSRGGGNSRARNNHLTRQMYNLFYTLRQLLWCYAMFGPTEGEGGDPFFHEAAYDTWLVLSLCCGNPGSMWFWLRARNLRQRRRRYARGWGNLRSASTIDDSSDLEGVSLIRRGTWGEERVPVPPPSDDQRGLLSLAVEFLYGPNSSPGPSEEDKWKLRGAFIVDKSSSRGNGPISLSEISPYVDSPPGSLEDDACIVSEGLLIVAHFNGKPSGTTVDETESASRMLFDFPELMAEGRFVTNYAGNRGDVVPFEDLDLFYVRESASPMPHRTTDRYALPEFLYEERKVLTKLTRKQFGHCFLVASLNFFGVIWFAQSLEPEGVLGQTLRPPLVTTLKRGLIPILLFYAKFFFCIPSVRLIYILGWNHFCNQRNEKRRDLATTLNLLINN